MDKRQHINKWVWLCSNKIESCRGSRGKGGQLDKVITVLGCRLCTFTEERTDTVCPRNHRNFGLAIVYNGRDD